MKTTRKQKPWLHFLKHILISFFAGVVLIPYFRIHPKPIHQFASELASWQRALLTMFPVALAFSVAYNIFSPSKNDIKNINRHPPIWLAWCISLFVVFAFDIAVGLTPKTYRSSVPDWCVYCLIPWIIVAFGKNLANRKHEECDSLQELNNTNGTSNIEEWIKTEQPSERDFFDTFNKAEKIHKMIDRGVRSIGLSGSFGSGKSTIVNQLIRKIKDSNKKSPIKTIVSTHSCWGFETSSSSIRELITDAIEQADKFIDTFYVQSLPENYAKAISSGSNWINKLIEPFVGRIRPKDQFERLSDSLEKNNAKLLFVIEDLDRNSNRTFDVQEIEGFLHQLKGYTNLYFIITGNASGPGQINFSKLCDRIEFVSRPSINDVKQLIEAFVELCTTREGNDLMEIEIHKESIFLNRSEQQKFMVLEVLSAFSRLAGTPRDIKRVLSKTHEEWFELKGEVFFDDLLFSNLLRINAPSSFQFLIDQWDYLRRQPSDYESEKRSQISGDWDRITANSEWDSEAVEVFIEKMFPMFHVWVNSETALGAHNDDTPFSLSKSMYWSRIVKLKISADEVSDQQVSLDLNCLENERKYAEFANNMMIKGDHYVEIINYPKNRVRLGSLGNARMAAELLKAIRNHHRNYSCRCTALSLLEPILDKVRIDDLITFVFEQTRESATVSLSLVNYLVSVYYNTVRREKSAIHRNHCELEESVIQSFTQFVSDDKQKLLNLIDPNDYWSLKNFVMHSTNIVKGGSNRQAARELLSGHLISLLRESNTTIAIQVAFLAVDWHKRIEEVTQQDIGLGVASLLFGNNLKEMLDLLARCVGSVEAGNVRAVVESVARAKK